MRVLAFRHVPFEGLGRIAEALENHGIGWQCIDPHAAWELPEVAAANGLIFMGGPMSANDDLPWLRAEEEVIRQAVRCGTPVLGVCLGAQLVARALGARVRRNPVKEIGWHEIELTPAGERDSLLGGLPAARETVFQWHSETFELPAGAALLARSLACRHQAFRLGAAVYGLQFHLEATPEMIAGWVREDANCGDVRELEAPIDPELHAAQMGGLAATVFGRWCGLVRSAGADRGET